MQAMAVENSVYCECKDHGVTTKESSRCGVEHIRIFKQVICAADGIAGMEMWDCSGPLEPRSL